MAKKILIADDSASMRQLVEYTLTSAGFEVIVAVDGKDAVTKSNGLKIDMVITDLNMPGMDGITLIKQLRGSPANRFTPIIMLTTESQADKKEEGKRPVRVDGSSSLFLRTPCWKQSINLRNNRGRHA